MSKSSMSHSAQYDDTSEAAARGPRWTDARSKLALDPTIVRDLARWNWLPTWLRIVAEWLGIATIAGIARTLDSVVADVFAILWIGSRQHALFVLMHEGAHFRVARNKSLNDALTNLLLAWPIGFRVKEFRASHFRHHQFTATERDPDWTRKRVSGWLFPLHARDALWLLFLELAGVTWLRETLAELRSRKPIPSAARPLRERLAELVSRSVMWSFRLGALGVVACSLGVKTAVVYWLVPLFTTYEVFLQFRNAAEHFAVDARWYGRTRTVRAGWVEALFLAPHAVGFHVEHHLYPEIPSYRLAELHELLAKNEWYVANVCVAPSYRVVLRRLTSTSS